MAVQGSQMSSVVGVPLGSVGRKVKDMPGKGTGPLLPPSDHRVTESPTADMEKCEVGRGWGAWEATVVAIFGTQNQTVGMKVGLACRSSRCHRSLVVTRKQREAERVRDKVLTLQ
jgi:hypothetical protein